MEGKKLRKKIKPKKERTPSFSDEESSGHNFAARMKRSSMSPGGGDKRRYHDGGGGSRGGWRDRDHDRYPGDPRDRDVRVGGGGGRYDDHGRLRESAGAAGGDNRGSRPRDVVGGEGNNRGSKPRDGGEANNRGSRPRDGGGEDNNRGSRPRDNDTTAAGKKRETSTERREREKAEYEAKLSKLSSPEREKMEARRKKFEGKVWIFL